MSTQPRTDSSRPGGCVRLHRACVHLTSYRRRPEPASRTLASEPRRRRTAYAVQGGHVCSSSLSDGSTRRADGADSSGMPDGGPPETSWSRNQLSVSTLGRGGHASIEEGPTHGDNFMSDRDAGLDLRV